MNKIIRNDFTYSEFLEYVTTTQGLEDNWNGSEEWSRDFTLTNSFKEAVDLAKYGWDSWLKMLEDIDLIVVNWNLSTEFAIDWATVDVARYVNGQPDCMINFIDEIEREKPQITIYVPISYQGWVNSKTASKYLISALKVIVKKMQTHDVKVYWVIETRLEHDDLVVVKLKDFGQQLVLNNFAFAFHPSFFRRLWFRYLETKPYWRGWYWWKVRDIPKKLMKTQVEKSYWETWFFPEINWQDFNEKDIEKKGA